MVLNPWIHPLTRGFFLTSSFQSPFFSPAVRHSRIRNQPLALATSDVPEVPLFSTPRTVKFESSCCTWTSSEGFLVGPCYLWAYLLEKGIAFAIKVITKQRANWLFTSVKPSQQSGKGSDWKFEALRFDSRFKPFSKSSNDIAMSKKGIT